MILKLGLGLGAVSSANIAPPEIQNVVNGGIQVIHLGADVVITI